ncbi:Trypsin [Rhodobacteraceae bacterium THAF1]|uniref:trypsin-like serine peptidase n=1 Tax=Palleronia sp. THAF1 TaxID=2587842 RepID=UPI000F3DF39E|nr:trypsin-like serine protease [Palleronia sp. THAF1]QFU07503.1 Trypsin [Palleronia sp. THAF1]VDC20464.1 Trypsin [Rhodobacteraceae bacterium THAF1]
MRHLKALGLSLLFGLLAGQSVAQDSALRALTTGDDAKPFHAVGRLELAGTGFCTATLLSAREVLTAAHCVVNDDGTQMRPEQVVFMAGFRDGRAEAHRTAKRIVVAQGYRANDMAISSLAYDVALIELDRPVDAAMVAPIGASSVGGAEIGVVSYAHDRAERPALQETCRVLGRDYGALVMSCDADFGTSGAPVLTFSGGAPRIVSVVSAKAHSNGQKVSIGTDLAATLPALRAELARGDGVFFRAAPKVLRLSQSEARQGGPGKFLKP